MWRNNGYLDNRDRGSFDSRGQNAPWPGARWKRNSIPRYLNTSQLRMIYEGCVSYVYFCHFPRLEFECHLRLPLILLNLFRRHRESPESRDDLHFRKRRTARVCFCKSDNRYHTCGVVINRFSFQSFAGHDRVTVSKLILSGMNTIFFKYVSQTAFAVCHLHLALCALLAAYFYKY